MRYYKFVKNWEPRPLEDVMKATIPQALKAYDEGNQQPWKDMNIVTTSPYVDIGGWRFLYSEYLKVFWVKTKYWGIQEYYALNKTAIRKAVGSHNIIKIVEV